VANEEVLFRRRRRELVIEKYGSLDRFYLETDFSKGHLSQILRGKRSPSLATNRQARPGTRRSAR
jgi:hypothetical protein